MSVRGRRGASIYGASGSRCALSSELGELPLNVRMLGEDLVLFRTRQGELGLLERHCSHRGASLEYGLPSDQGIVCCYHGWHYATDGRIIETPNDPTSKAAGQLYHAAYRTHEYQGIVFAYMGPPEDAPDFPILDTFVEPDNEMVPFSLYMPCNWLQCLENTQDPIHSCFLHTRVSGVQFGVSWGRTTGNRLRQDTARYDEHQCSPLEGQGCGSARPRTSCQT